MNNAAKKITALLVIGAMLLMGASGADAMGRGNGKGGGNGKGRPVPVQPEPTGVINLDAGGSIEGNLFESDTFVVTDAYTGGAVITFVNNGDLTLNGVAIPEDTLDVSGIDADVNTAGDQAFTLVDEFSGTAGELIAGFVSGTGENNQFTTVRGDTDGDGVVDFRISVGVDNLGLSLAGTWDNNLVL